MKNKGNRGMKTYLILLIAISILLVSQPVQAYNQSANVVVIGGSTLYPADTNYYTAANYMSYTWGGYLPVTGTDLAGIAFSPMMPSDVNNTSLAVYDTAVLNMATSATQCSAGTLSSTAKAALVSFVDSGKKLIIYDSECSSSVNYSWLPFPFTTSNPGAYGAQGTLNIVEENTLSSSNTASPYFINASYLGSSTDAVGDMNVMTTYDANWCVDMSGTNIIPTTGPVHTYAKTGMDKGLMIYNGLDMDAMGYGNNSLRKIFVQELTQPFNPSYLPCGVTVVGITLTPAAATNEVGTTHTVTATLKDLLGNPQPNEIVYFMILSGPNYVPNSSGIPNTTDSSGQASFTYTSNGLPGTDIINACFIKSGQTVCSQNVTKDWVIINKPPTANAGPDQRVEQDSLGGASVTLDGSASTDDGKLLPLTYTWTWAGGAAVGVNPTVTLPLGTTTVTLTVYDGQFWDNDTVVVTVVDSTPPGIVIKAEPIVLWPPNHKYETIAISDFVLSVTDICDAGVSIDDIVITSVSSDEPEDVTGNGDGDTLNDIVIVDSQTVDLRSEREGVGNGRVYSVNFELTDASGNTATGSFKVEVPHDQSGPSAVDDGAAAGYTVVP